MFGHENKDDDQQTDQQDGTVTAPTSPITDDNLGLGDESNSNPAPQTAADPATDTGGSIASFNMNSPTKPGPPAAAAVATAPPTTPPAAAPTTPPVGAPAQMGDPDLLSIKQHALQQLSPLINHLDQSPEEKFRTTMMMIQASDDQTMVAQAYAAAQAIPDEKIRAQALLDIVNEINYFTQQHNNVGKS